MIFGGQIVFLLFFASVVQAMAGAPLRPVRVASFFVEPHEPARLRWAVGSGTAAEAVAYVVRDYHGQDVVAGQTEIEADSLEISVTLAPGFYEVAFPTRDQRFGVVARRPYEDPYDPYFAIDAAMSWLVGAQVRDDLVATAGALREIAERWRPAWAALEIWNEPDIFFGDHLPADQDAALAKAIAYALGPPEDGVPLVGGVVAYDNREFLDNAARNGLLDCTGTFSFHTYARAEQMEDLVARYRQWLADHGRATTPLCRPRPSCCGTSSILPRLRRKPKGTASRPSRRSSFPSRCASSISPHRHTASTLCCLPPML